MPIRPACTGGDTDEEEVGRVEPLLDGLQLAGFLLVSVAILAVLVAVTIVLAVFLYMADRKIVIVQGSKHSQESHAPVEVRS